MSRVFLLGVPLDPVTRDEAVTLLLGFLRGTGGKHIATPNSEMLVEAHRHAAFRAVLQHTDLNLPDSTGVVLAAKLPQRVTGIDTMQRLCGVLTEEHAVFLLGAAQGVAEKAARILRERNARLRIVGAFAGSPSEADAPDILRRINEAKPHLLFVAFGAPAQDMWIAKHLHNMPSVRVAMGVGGAFDFIAGKQKRAPQLLRAMGLEWLWRLLREPKRLPRIWRATVVFPWLCLLCRSREGLLLGAEK